MKYLQYYNFSDDIHNDKRSRALVVYVENKDNLSYAPIKGYEEGNDVIIEELSDDALIGYLKCTFTVSADTTLAVYYTKDSFDSETPDETISLTTGDNTFYFDLSIYRIGILEYDRSTGKRISLNENITKITLDGIWEDSYRMFDSTINKTSITYIDCSKLNTSKNTNMFCMFQYLTTITSVGEISSWDVSNVTNMSWMFYDCEKLKYIGDLSNWDVSNVSTMQLMFNKCNALTDVGDLSSWNTSNVSTMYAMFYGCNNITSLGDLSSWDVSHVTDMYALFGGCLYATSFGDLNSWNVSNVINMQGIFSNCYALISVGDLSSWNTSKVTNMSYMFNNCRELTSVGDLSLWNTSNVSNMLLMFCYCYELTSVGDLSSWNVSNLSNMSFMFYGCYELTSVGDLSSWNTSNVSNMAGMFWNCYNLTSVGDLSSWNAPKCISSSGMFGLNPDELSDTSVYMKFKLLKLDNLFVNGVVLDLNTMFQHCHNLTSVGDLRSWNTSNVTNMSYMFNRCYKLMNIGDLSSWNTSNVSNMRLMFNECYELTSVGDLSSWDVSNVTDILSMFYECYKLTSVGDLSSWDVSNITDMMAMFCYCYELNNIGNIGNWDLSNVTIMIYMFKRCYNISNVIDVSGWNFPNITSLDSLFDTCYSLPLKGFKNWDVSKITNMHALFRRCVSIDPEELDFSTWDMSKVTNVALMLANTESGDGSELNAHCTQFIGDLSITSIKHFPAIPKTCGGGASICLYDWYLTTIEASNTISNALSFALSPLTKESALVILNALDTENKSTLTLSDYTYNLLSDDDIKIGTDKGWSIAKANPIGKFKCIGSNNSILETYDTYVLITSNDDLTFDDLTLVFDDGIEVTGTISNIGGYLFKVENNKVISYVKLQTDDLGNKVYKLYLGNLSYNNKVYRFNNEF